MTHYLPHVVRRRSGLTPLTHVVLSPLVGDERSTLLNIEQGAQACSLFLVALFKSNEVVKSEIVHDHAPFMCIIVR